MHAETCRAQRCLYSLLPASLPIVLASIKYRKDPLQRRPPESKSKNKSIPNSSGTSSPPRTSPYIYLYSTYLLPPPKSLLPLSPQSCSPAYSNHPPCPGARSNVPNLTSPAYRPSHSAAPIVQRRIHVLQLGWREPERRE